jgi:hypothetical protein
MLVRCLVLSCFFLFAATGSECSPSGYPRVLARSFVHIPVQDSHMHIMDWSKLAYNNAPGSIHYYNWTQDDYLKASKPSSLIPSRALFMGVMGVSSSQRLLQSQVVQALADRSSHPFVPFNAIVTVTSCDQDLLDVAKLSAMLDDLQATVPLSVGCRCIFPALWTHGAIAGVPYIICINLESNTLHSRTSRTC